MGTRALAMAALLAGATAGAEGPRRTVVVLASSGAEHQLASRVEGQLADLELRVRTVPAELPAPPPARQEEARRRAAAAGADAVVWFTLEEGAWRVHVEQGGELVERTVGEATGTLAGSATLETVGMVVRTALRGLGAAAPAPLPVAGEAGEAGVPPGGFGELAWSAVLDGQGAAPFHGGSAAGGVDLGRLRVGLSLRYQPPVTLRSASATVTQSRWQVGALLGWELLGDEARRGWSLRLELGAEVAALPRTTLATSAALAPTPAATAWTPVLAPALRAARRLGGPLWLTLAVGADAVLLPPRLGVEAAAGFELLSAQWPVQPRASLGLAVEAF